jgi:serine/threonine protein kinase
LHEVGVVHGDVCLENCGKFEDKWKLMSSLGMQPIGKRFDSARMGESSPPEAVEMLHNVVETRGQESSSRRATFKGDIVAGPAVDMWAFGKLIYEVLTGEPLIRFDSNKDTRYDNRALLKLVGWNEGDLRNVVNSLEDSGVSNLGVDLVSHCLLPDPSERPSTMDEILDHPFWKDMRRKGVMARRSNNKGRHEI